MTPLPLTVCLISGAEAHRIGAALKSVQGWTAEILVVLNEDVTDGTDRIVETHGGRVFREAWKGFIGQKNSASEKSTQRWLLNLDADEVVTPELRREIEAVVGEDGRGYAAFNFPRCTHYCGRWIRHGDWYPDRVLRLWHKDRGRWTGDEPHAFLKVEGPVGRLKADLLHYSNDSIARQIAKIAPYHSDFVRKRIAAGRSSGPFELVVRPAWRFFRAYCLRQGFLDGWPGFYIAALSAFSTLTRYMMVKEEELNHKPKP